MTPGPVLAGVAKLFEVGLEAGRQLFLNRIVDLLVWFKRGPDTLPPLPRLRDNPL